MPRIQGRINKLYDNRFKDGQKVTYPYYKMFVGSDELRIYTDQNIDFKEGDEVGLTYAVSKKNNWYVTKNPNGGFSINKIKNSMPDDDLPKSEKEWLSAPVENPTDFNPNKLDNELVPPHLKKDQQIFVTALLKSSIEGSFLNPFEREKVDKAILEFKDIYNINFK
tara:strand:- start:2823 stop:3320 length:498 start_codon:yes stop_codon:yes gene_type:complete